MDTLKNRSFRFAIARILAERQGMEWLDWATAHFFCCGFVAHATAARRSRKTMRFMLNAMLALPIFAFARAMPMVRAHSPMRPFCSAKGCSTAERTFERAAFAGWCCGFSALPGARRKWIFETSPAPAIRHH
jgi:hypothetical protein